MKFPNKVTSVNKSIIYDMFVLMKSISEHPISIIDLLRVSKIEDISIFTCALSCLFAIGKIRINDNKELETC